MVLSRVEALEWAADYAERTKLFEIPPESARVRYEIIQNLADSAIQGEPPPAPAAPRRLALADGQCLEHIQYLTDKLRNSSTSSTKERYRKQINEHIVALQHPDTTHPKHDREPEAVAAEYDDESADPLPRKKSSY